MGLIGWASPLALKGFRISSHGGHVAGFCGQFHVGGGQEAAGAPLIYVLCLSPPLSTVYLYIGGMILVSTRTYP